MIYAQRPDATACASMELWNDTMRRWVKPRSKGIALIRTGASGRPHLEYVFSVEEPPAPGSPDLSLFSLFPTMEEQIENIAQAQAEDRQTAQQQTSLPAGLVPSAVISRALTCGGNEKHSIGCIRRRTGEVP